MVVREELSSSADQEEQYERNRHSRLESTVPMSQASTTAAQAASQSIRQAVHFLAPVIKSFSYNPTAAHLS